MSDAAAVDMRTTRKSSKMLLFLHWLLRGIPLLALHDTVLPFFTHSITHSTLIAVGS